MDAWDKALAEQLAAFEKQQEPNLLLEALGTLASEPQPQPGDVAVRQRQLSRWLRLLAMLDAHIDPQWDANDVPVTGVIPPPSDGVAHFSGIDPSAIRDPAKRRQYEEALKASNDHAERYRIQHELRDIDRQAKVAAELLLAGISGDTPASRRSLEEMIARSLATDARKAWLLALIANPPRAR